MVYVQQSSPREVFENCDLREWQFAFTQFPQRSGWPVERVLVIDEDQGKTADQRTGFQRLMTEFSPIAEWAYADVAAN